MRRSSLSSNYNFQIDTSEADALIASFQKDMVKQEGRMMDVKMLEEERRREQIRKMRTQQNIDRCKTVVGSQPCFKVNKAEVVIAESQFKPVMMSPFLAEGGHATYQIDEERSR